MKKCFIFTCFILITLIGSSIILTSYKEISSGHVVCRTYVDLPNSGCKCNVTVEHLPKLTNTSPEDSILEELAWKSLQKKIAESKTDLKHYQKLELCPETPPDLVGRLNITENFTLEKVTDPESLKRVIFGGRYRPRDCNARDHVAIIIPYRDRKKDLDLQLRLLHQVLQRQQCDYMIFVVEMALPTAFNKGLINNAGFTTAMMINNFSCVIFQDVDAFMMDDRNLYRCGSDPRHYLAYSTKYGDKGLPNPELYGGVIGFTPWQFTKVNGFSNLYFGWGEEDNDLYIRVQHAGLKYVRSSKDVGGYLGFKHDHDATNPEGSAYSLIRNAKARATVEGVGTIRFRRYAVEYRDLYTWILIGVEQADITQDMRCAVNGNDPAMRGTTILSPKLVLEAVNVTMAVNDISILNDVSILAENGELVAIMGPSGSGKTTLLDTIAGRRTPQSGFVKLNGTPIDGKLRRKLGFVLQEDTFFADLTLWETLYFTSMVRLPESIPRAEKVQHIEDLAESLGVTKCLNTRIGDMFNPGLSGGEKKRASIICELLTDPDILLLDEPTSGLDYSTALTLMQLLKKLADEKNKIIIFSIHQPSSQMYHMFDKLLLLAQGTVAFFGDKSDALPYLENVGFECEMQYNPADFIMGILKSDESTIKRLTDAFSNRHGAIPLNDLAMNDKTVCLSLAVTNDAFILEERDIEVQISEHNSLDQTIVGEITKWPTSFSTQFRMLSWRTFKVSRGRILHLYELLQSMLLAVILGLVFFQIPQTIESVRDRMGLLFITVAHWTFGAAFDAITAFSSERGVITKEIQAKAYRVSAYYLARTLTELPLVLTLPVFFYILAYWMAGLHGLPQFFTSLLVLLLSTLSAQGLGYMIGAACMDVKFGIFLANTTILFALILSGFITQTLPAWFNWAKYLSFIFHPLSAMSLILFQDMQPLPCNTLSTDIFPQCLTNATVMITGKDVLLRAGITLPVYCYITGLAIFFLVFRIIGFVALKVRFKGPK